MTGGRGSAGAEFTCAEPELAQTVGIKTRGRPATDCDTVELSQLSDTHPPSIAQADGETCLTSRRRAIACCIAQNSSLGGTITSSDAASLCQIDNICRSTLHPRV